MATGSSPSNIVIIGGGVIGASTAYYLTRQPGFNGKVTVIEGTKIAAGASGKAGGFLAKDWHGGPTRSLGLLSYDLHQQLATEHGGASRWGYRQLQTLSVDCSLPPSSTSRKARPHQSSSSAPQWLDQSLVRATEQLGDETSTAQVTPRLFTESLVKLAEEKGAAIVLGEAVGIERGPDGTEVTGVRVRRQEGGEEDVVAADAVVVAAGPWSGRLAQKLLGDAGKRVRIEGSRAHSIIINAPALSAHALFVSSLPAAGGGHSEPEIYARPDGTAYICGASDESPLPVSAADVTVNPDSISKLKADCAKLSPEHLGSKAEVVAEQACYLPISKTGSPLVTSLAKGIWIASGHAVWGITLGPGTGKVLAELITGQSKTSADVRYLKP